MYLGVRGPARAFLEPRLEKLLELELLEDATGRRRSVLEFLTAPRAFVLRGADPVPPELAMWMGDVLRLRGRVVESALAGVELADGEAILERAKMGAQRWQRWLGHETSGPVVPESDDELFREAIADECGLTGHVAVRDPETAPLASVVRVFLQERPLEHLRLDRSQLPLPVDAAFAWDDRLRPTFDFDGVERSDDLTEATVNVILVALRGVEHRARELAADERGRRVLCAALSTLARLPQSFGTEVSSADFPELWRARVWSGTDPGRRLSLDQLARWAAKRQALCFVVESSAAQGAAPDGRPVLKVAEAELDDICRLLGGDIERVPYERAFAVTKDERRAAVREVFRHELEELKLSGAPTVTLEQDHFVALIAPSPVNRMVEMHAGVVLARLPKHGGWAPRCAWWTTWRACPAKGGMAFDTAPRASGGSRRNPPCARS